MKQCKGRSLGQVVRHLEQYREPLCFELAGEHLRLLLQADDEYNLDFLSEKTASLCGRDIQICETTYECLKLKEKLYMVFLHSTDCESSLGMVIDLKTGFTAMQLVGEDELWLGTLIPLEGKGSTQSDLGAIELSGRSTLWLCSPQDRFAQTYTNMHSFSISSVGTSGTVDTLQYSALYFKLREDIFLIASADRTGGESIMMLADMNTVRAVGMSRLAGQLDNGESHCLLFSAYGAFLPANVSVEDALLSDDIHKYKRRIVGKEVVNPVTHRPIPSGLKQYVQPRSEELAGRSLEMRLDGQEPVLIRFLNATTLEWAYRGKPFQQETYECVKGDDAVYMIVSHPHSHEPASCVTLIWDTDTRLITVILAWEHKDALYPRLVVSGAIFGAENRMNEPLPTLRHHYTDELIGKRILWHYTANDDVLHICFDRTHFRLGAASVTLASNPSADALANYRRLMLRQAKYPYYEERVYYIKIKEGLYLYSVIEYAMCRLLENQGGGELLALVNTLRMRYVGRTFGLDAQENAGHDIVGAPGRFLDIPDEVENLPCPIYNV